MKGLFYTYVNRRTFFNGFNNFSQLLTVPAVISPLSILSQSGWRRGREGERETIFFSAVGGLSLANHIQD